MTALSNNFWGLTAFFNPAGYPNKKENFTRFRESSRSQGLRLLAVELAFGDRPFELDASDAEILVQLRTDAKNMLWQKERLLNIGLERLPDACEKLAWLDGDILFENANWIAETAALLDSFAFVQPFSFVTRLAENTFDVESVDDLPMGQKPRQRMHGIAYGVTRLGKSHLDSYDSHGETGFAWAARREVLEKLGGFKDEWICGSADLLMARMFFETKLGEGVSFASGNILHLWHGRLADRNYEGRLDILKTHAFDPKTDIRIASNGVWEWASDKQRLHECVRNYFKARKEMGWYLKGLFQ